MSVHIDQVPDGIRYTLDTLSVGALIGTLAGWLPAIASLLTVIYMTLRIANEIENWRDRRGRRGRSDA